MPFMISVPKPNHADSTEYDQKYRFGYFETCGKRRGQEDAIAWHVLQPNELIPTGESERLHPIEIGHRLWTTYQLLDTPELKAGTTASTTIYDGHGHFITATLADAVSFLVVYDLDGEALGVVRLNSVTHKPDQLLERKRIERAGGTVELIHPESNFYRVNGILAVSRAIGDHADDLKEGGVCSEATIDIVDLEHICQTLRLDRNYVHTVQIIATCDGFTDGSREKQTKRDHENYLLNCLRRLNCPTQMTEDQLAASLAQLAINDGSMDNVSVAVQTVTNSSVFVGVYDGHAGKKASSYVATHIGKVFKAQCALTREAYRQQALSVDTRAETYQRDNHDEEVELTLDQLWNRLDLLTRNYYAYVTRRLDENSLEYQVAHHLVEILHGVQSKDAQIKAYYDYLYEPSLVRNLTNIELIQQDTSIPAVNLLKFIAIVIATLATLLVPGLVMMALVHYTTGQQPFDLLKGEGERFSQEIQPIKEKFVFFRMEPFASPDEYLSPVPVYALMPMAD